MATGDTQATQGARPTDHVHAPSREPCWLVAVELAHFRGVPGRMRVHLADDHRRQSVVILGDNGTGKSSLVDAVELALRGQARGARNQAAHDVVQSRATSSPSEAIAELSGGRRLVRTFATDDVTGELSISSKGPVSGFMRSPLVLRRSDILTFWQTPVETRQLVFVRSFFPGQVDLELPQERRSRLTRERADAKQERDSALERLAGLTGEDVRTVPRELKPFESWVNWKVYGFDRDTQRYTKTPSRQVKAAVERVREARDRVAKANQALKNAEGSSGTGRNGSDKLSGILGQAASERLADRFNRISPSAPLRNVQLRIGERTGAALDLVAELADGSIVRPDDVLSEANRDLLALLIFVAVAEAAVEYGDAPVLVLDDVFQSVDAPVRLSVMDLLVSQLTDWQFIVTTHDRLWREQVNSVFQRRGVSVRNLEITRWTFENGPTIRDGGADIRDGLAGALDRAEPATIASQAGLVLEELADIMSWTLGVRVVRRPGDRYTLNDLWPPLAKKLKITELDGLAELIDSHIHLRNLLGAHPNAWARSASLDEADRFGRAVLDMLDRLRCATCGRFVEPTPVANEYTCRCGSTRVSSPPS